MEPALQGAEKRRELQPVFPAQVGGQAKRLKIRRWNIIAGLCQWHGYRIGAEIGVSTGRFTAYLCNSMPDLRMIAVDRWEEQPRANAETYLKADGWQHEESYAKFCEFTERNYPGRVSIRRKDSVEAAYDVADGCLDFVFIDADHSREGCLADINAWTPKVRMGGMVSGHDYNDKWPGVIEAVNETGPVLVMSDSVWVRFKK